MMAGVQHPPPEHPNALPLQAAEEGATLQPPSSGAVRKLRQPSPHQPNVLVDVRLNDGLLAGREQLFNGRFLRADELPEESALGKKLVDKNGADRICLLMRIEVEKIVRQSGATSPHRRIPKMTAQQADLPGVKHLVMGAPQKGEQLRLCKRMRVRHGLVQFSFVQARQFP